MTRMLLFGPGFTGSRIAEAVARLGWQVETIGRQTFEDEHLVADRIASASHILSTVPPAGDSDPILARHAESLSAFRGWTGYLSSTGVYGDTGGAWVDESAPIGRGRRSARATADLAWLDLGARVFRLPGIYGPGRSPLDRLVAGEAYRVASAGQVFSRIHVDDIVQAIICAFDAPCGAYNIADDLPAPQSEVTGYAAGLLGLPLPPLVEVQALSPAARAFYSENRRVANGKARRVLGWEPRYPTYREGLRSLSAMINPPIASALPIAAVGDHR